MKPTSEQVREWAIRCGDDWDSTLPDDKRLIQEVAALAYSAGVAAERERAIDAVTGVAMQYAEPVWAYQCVEAIRGGANETDE